MAPRPEEPARGDGRTRQVGERTPEHLAGGSHALGRALGPEGAGGWHLFEGKGAVKRGSVWNTAPGHARPAGGTFG